VDRKQSTFINSIVYSDFDKEADAKLSPLALNGALAVMALSAKKPDMMRYA
jgi:hypothetical protein